MVEVGDKGIVMNYFGEKEFIALGDVEVGDTVAVYNLADETRIAVPLLSMNVGDMVFATPSFDFAGFDWSLDFNINLIPLLLGAIGSLNELIYPEDWTHCSTPGSIRNTYNHTIEWNGAGEVWLSRSNSMFLPIWVDDAVNFTGPEGSTGWLMGPPNYDYGTGAVSELSVNVTEYLVPGENDITISVKDVVGGNYGAYEDIYIIQLPL